MNKIRTLIVDDEAIARHRVKRFLSEITDIEIIGECEDGAEALAKIRGLTPDLVLLDVQMPRMNGFDVVREIGTDLNLAVVFITSHDEFALRAFDVHALDYLLKPFNRHRFQQAVERAKQTIRNKQAVELNQRLMGLLNDIGPGGTYINRLEVRSGGRVTFLMTKDIDWIGAADSYSELHVSKETHLIRASLGQLESQLDPSKFVRIHRSTIVNIDRVREMKPLFNKDQVLILRDGTRLTVSRTYYDKLLFRLRK